MFLTTIIPQEVGSSQGIHKLTRPCQTAGQKPQSHDTPEPDRPPQQSHRNKSCQRCLRASDGRRPAAAQRGREAGSARSAAVELGVEVLEVQQVVEDLRGQLALQQLFSRLRRQRQGLRTLTAFVLFLTQPIACSQA